MRTDVRTGVRVVVNGRWEGLLDAGSVPLWRNLNRREQGRWKMGYGKEVLDG